MRLRNDDEFIGKKNVRFFVKEKCHSLYYLDQSQIRKWYFCKSMRKLLNLSPFSLLGFLQKLMLLYLCFRTYAPLLVTN